MQLSKIISFIAFRLTDISTGEMKNREKQRSFEMLIRAFWLHHQRINEVWAANGNGFVDCLEQSINYLCRTVSQFNNRTRSPFFPANVNNDEGKKKDRQITIEAITVLKAMWQKPSNTVQCQMFQYIKCEIKSSGRRFVVHIQMDWQLLWWKAK